MNTKKEYFELSKSVIKECQDRSHELFKKTCDVLSVTSEEDKDILFEYLFNDSSVENTQQIIQKYTENV